MALLGGTQRSPQPHMGARQWGLRVIPCPPCLGHRAARTILRCPATRGLGNPSFHISKGAGSLDRKLSSCEPGRRGCPGDAGSPRAPCCGPLGRSPASLGPSRPQPGGRQHTGHPTSLRYVSPNSCRAPSRSSRWTDVTHRADSRPALGSGSAPPPRRERDPFVQSHPPQCSPSSCTPPDFRKNRRPGACAGELLSSANAACSRIQP